MPKLNYQGVGSSQLCVSSLTQIRGLPGRRTTTPAAVAKPHEQDAQSSKTSSNGVKTAANRSGTGALRETPTSYSSNGNSASRLQATAEEPTRVVGASNGKVEFRQRGEPHAPRRTPIIDLNASSLMDNDPRRVGLVDLLRNDGGPPRFISPYVSGRDPATGPADLPLMVYLPGIDGTGLAASRQFPSLVQSFDLRALSVPGHDRTPFRELVRIVIDYMEREVSESSVERPIYLLGESFGGVIAIAVAAERPDLIDRVVLVNPATSFPRSVWPRLGPLLPQIPKDLYGLAPVALAPFLGNPLLLASFGVDRSSSWPEQISQLQEGIQNLLPQLQAIAEILPPPTLEWKLKLLEEGSRIVEPMLKNVTQRVLLLASEGDWLIPSADEGPRLKEKLPRCRLRMMPGSSHALLQEAGVDLPSIMREEGFYTARRHMSAPLKSRSKQTFGTASPLELPTNRELEISTDEALGWLRRLASPVFFSTGEDGMVRQGLSGVPHHRPMLFVGNHQTYALDIGPMVEALIKDRSILPRGLAHPAIWAQQTPPGIPGPSRDASMDTGDGPFASFMATYGAVPVGARNFFKLMQNGEAALLYPGGVREAYKGKGEKYKVFWPERRSEFVRMAAKFGATIVPFAGIGTEDGVTMLADAQEIRQIPVLGDYLAKRAKDTIPQARRGASDVLQEELFIAPFSVPTSIPRFYYTFQKPIQTSPEDLKTEGRCDQLYQQVKREVEAGIDFLLEGRERDPYKDLVPRLLYEASWGGKQAPTFRP